MRVRRVLFVVVTAVVVDGAAVVDVVDAAVVWMISMPSLISKSS